MDSGPVSRKTLGRGASLCDLYDVRKDQFCGVSLLRAALPEAAITSIEIPGTYSAYTTEETYHEKFRKLLIEGALKISVLGGLFSLSGSLKYLNDESSSQKVVRGTLIYKITTKEDTINLLHGEVRPHVIEQHFLNSEATHVVHKIRWGANVMVTFEKKVHNYSQAKEIAGMLQATLTQAAQICGELVDIFGEDSGNNTHASGAGAQIKYSGNNTEELNGFAIRVEGDVVLDDHPAPQSVDEVLKLMSMIPQYIKKFNQGKGKPLEIELYPIKDLAVHFGTAIGGNELKNDIDLARIERVESEMDNIVRQKQILNDFVADVNDFSEHVSRDDLHDFVQYKQRVNTADAEFRNALKQAILAIRQAGAPASVLDDAIQNYQNNPHCAHNIHTFMDEKSALKAKMDFFEVMKEKGVDFLPKSKSVDNFVARHDKQDVYVLHYSDTLMNTEEWHNTYPVFMEKIRERNDAVDAVEDSIAAPSAPAAATKFGRWTSTNIQLTPGPKFLVVDVALHRSARGADTSVRIVQYSNGRLVTHDVVKEKGSAVTQNIIRWERIDKYGRPLRKVVDVPLIICPSAMAYRCTTERRLWVCHRCNQKMQYGLSDHFYCNCGGVLLQDCQFKCCDPQHGSQFSSFVSLDELKEQLPKVFESDCINLLLGQTGVGKTTWVNALRNYVEYTSLQEAIHGGVKVLSPSRFIHEGTSVLVGEEDSQEACTKLDSVGESSTKCCRSHYFIWGARRIQIIDTPGIGDVGGPAQDKRNTEHILQCLNAEEQLHGICILLKPNEDRLTLEFQFCLTSLLTNLHKNAANNIMFCYTNARQTNFCKGETDKLVKRMLKGIQENHGQKIPYDDWNTFFFDSESFRCLACIQNGSTVTPKMEKAASGSWDKGVAETMRLLATVQQVDPHLISETVSINDARKLITLLFQPLAHIANLITRNVNQISLERHRIEQSKNEVEQLQACRYREREVLETTPLSTPRTVCTGKSCVSPLDSGIEYPTCHNNCWICSVAGDSVGHWLLACCQCMSWWNGGKCRVCGCSWVCHQLMRYATRRVLERTEDESVMKQIEENICVKHIVELTMKNLENESKQLEDEQNEIKTASARFAVFLKENAITPFSDTVDKHLEYSIEKCRLYPAQTAEAESLVKLLEEYRKEKQRYEENLAAYPSLGSTSKKLRPEDVPTVIAELQKLPQSGNSVRDQMRVARECTWTQFEQYSRGATFSQIKSTVADMLCRNKSCNSVLQKSCGE